MDIDTKTQQRLDSYILLRNTTKYILCRIYTTPQKPRFLITFLTGNITIKYDVMLFEIPLALAPRSADARPSAQPPIDTSGIFWSTCLGEVGQQI